MSDGSERSDAARRLAPVALVVAVGVLGAVVGFTPLRSFDYGWHLRTGELIAETQAIPRTDPFTYTVPGARWVDVHWTFQLALYALYQWGGHQGVRIGKGVCVLALLAVLGAIGWCRSRAAVSALALGILVTGSAERLMERPELLSFLLLAILLALLDRHERRGDRWVFAIVPLQLLWVNLHGLFAVGIAVCAMALLAELVRPLILRDAHLRRSRAWNLAAVVALSVLVCFLNPNGLDAVRLPLQQLGMIGLGDARSDLGRTIQELRPILSVPGGAGTLAAAGGLALAAMALNWRGFALFDALVFLAFLFLALGAQRNAALLAIVSVPIAVRHFGEFADRHPPPRWAVDAACVAVLVLLSTAIAVRVKDQGSFWAPGPLLEDRFPETAVEWIARERPDGPIYHAMADGGYLIWRLHPDYPVMVDGRLEVFGEERFAQLRVTASGRPAGFRRLDDEYHFGVALIHFRFFPALHLLTWLNRSPEWRLVELDGVAAVFVRIGDAPPRWPELGAGGSELLPALAEGGDDERDLQRLEERFALLKALDRPESALALARETCERFRGRPAGPFVCIRRDRDATPERPVRVPSPD